MLFKLLLLLLLLYFDGYVDFFELLIPCWSEVKCLCGVWSCVTGV